MKAGSIFSRRCSHATAPALRALACRQRYPLPSTWRYSFKDHWRRPQGSRPLLLAATLSPAAFIKLSEEDHEDGKSGEQEMLKASREEIEKKVPDEIHGVKRVFRKLWVFLDLYVYEPIATSLRFLHLVIIFVPVIVAVPAIWIGRRRKDRENERSGTLWWYGFLVSSMERAGPAFIKVFGLALTSHGGN